MPRHDLYFNLPQVALGKVDAHLQIYQDDEKLGEITLSKGSIEYYPANAKTPISLTWTQFDKLMKEYGN